MSETTGHDYLQGHQVSGEVLLLDIEQESIEILEAARSAGVGHAAKTLVKEGALRLILIGFKAGSSLREHSAGGPVTIEALSGNASVSVSGREEALQPGRTLVLGSDVSHSVVATSDAVLLLTIAWPQG